MATALAREIATFDRRRAQLEREHAGKWVLIHGEDVVDVYDTFQTAAEAGLRLYGNGPFLIRQVGQDKIELPASVTYGLSGRADFATDRTE